MYFSKTEITLALQELGQLALEQGESIELMVVGGAFMVLAYDARPATKDVDALILAPPTTVLVRQLAKQIALKKGWPTDWLNDGVKGFFKSISMGEVLLESPGIRVHAPSIFQILAMKLGAWRDDTDIGDALYLLRQLVHQNKDEVWQSIEPYLVAGTELKAQYAFEDLWEKLND